MLSSFLSISTIIYMPLFSRYKSLQILVSRLSAGRIDLDRFSRMDFDIAS